MTRAHRRDPAPLRNREVRICALLDVKTEELGGLIMRVKARKTDDQKRAEVILENDGKMNHEVIKAHNMISNVQSKRIPLERPAFGIYKDNKDQNSDEDFTEEDETIIEAFKADLTQAMATPDA